MEGAATFVLNEHNAAVLCVSVSGELLLSERNPRSGHVNPRCCISIKISSVFVLGTLHTPFTASARKIMNLYTRRLGLRSKHETCSH